MKYNIYVRKVDYKSSRGYLNGEQRPPIMFTLVTNNQWQDNVKYVSCTSTR